MNVGRGDIDMIARAERREPIVATAEDARSLERLRHVLEATQSEGMQLVDSAGQRLDIPRSVYELLRQTVPILAEGDAVALEFLGEEVTVQAAADFLNVSEHYLAQLLEAGEIPSTASTAFHAQECVPETGPRRHIRLSDLIRYKRQRDELRREALKELTQLSQELGLYS